MSKYTELWDKIKSLIEKKNDKRGECDKKYMKVKFDSGDNLSLNEIQKLYNLAIVGRPVFQEESKYYPQFF